MDEILQLLTSPDAWVAFLTLSLMEIVLGIDNVIFLAILVGRVPDKEQREKLRKVGLGLALVLRIGLLLTLSAIMALKEPLFSINLMGFSKGFSGRDLILLGGGLFLLWKSANEIYLKVEAEEEQTQDAEGKKSWSAIGILVQIALVDIVFSLDSVITAVGMAKDIPVMVAAMVVAVGVMLMFSGMISDFVEKHPSIKILALAFLMLIGVMLLVEGLGQHVSKGYIYFAMAFSLVIELFNMRLRTNKNKKYREKRKNEGLL